MNNISISTTVFESSLCFVKCITRHIYHVDFSHYCLAGRRSDNNPPCLSDRVQPPLRAACVRISIQSIRSTGAGAYKYLKSTTTVMFNLVKKARELWPL